MKKVVVLIGLCALTLSASAQFKVHGDDNSSYYITCNVANPNNSFNSKSGFSLTTTGGGPGTIYGGDFSVSYNGPTNIGFRGHATYGGTCMGIVGSSGAASKTIGLYGTIGSTSLGAGVYGTIYSGWGTALTSGLYAGFFDGSVKVTGSIITGTTLQGALLGESSSSLGSSSNALSLRSGSVATSLSGLNVTTYQKERPERPEVTDSFFDDMGIDSLHRGEEPEPDIMDEQFYKKTHYALNADRLEEAFPDLVYVRKDGTKAINYMEMIPLLVQSINELNAEIEVLKGQNPEETAKKTRSATEIQGSLKSQNKLYQNTPNPFKEQTIIRFSLADDVQNAAICIFDMTGKTIKKLPISSGMESVSIGGYELGEGMFLYSLVVNGQEIDTKRMIISK